MRPCWELPEPMLRGDVELAPDSCGVPAPAVDREASLRSRGEASLWLPEGHHWDLHIEHDHRVDTGPMASGRPSWLQHITVSRWESVDAMRDVLHAKSAEVHFVIGARPGTEHPVVIQCLPLNRFGKGMIHLSGQPETNRSGKIQIELCADEQSIRNFTHYRALANLFVLVQHRRSISNRLARSFSNTQRFANSGSYANVTGIHGHMHAPQNTHVDPTPGFEGAKFVRTIREIPDGGYAL